MPRPEVSPADAEPSRIAPMSMFTGHTVVREVSKALGTEGLQVNAVHFDPGVRSRPHAHDRDQVLVFPDGPGLIAVDGGEDQLVAPGAFVMLPANTAHMHGAPEGQPAMHISLMPTVHANFFDCEIPAHWQRWREG
jgi:quercetin dioxygenase-like cupin family protein